MCQLDANYRKKPHKQPYWAQCTGAGTCEMSARTVTQRWSACSTELTEIPISYQFTLDHAWIQGLRWHIVGGSRTSEYHTLCAAVRDCLDHQVPDNSQIKVWRTGNFAAKNHMAAATAQTEVPQHGRQNNNDNFKINKFIWCFNCESFSEWQHEP